MIHDFQDFPSGLQPMPADLAAWAQAEQATCHELNLAAVNSKADLMTAFATALALPAGFGRNWDALYDVLTDPDHEADQKAVPERLALALHGYAELGVRQPKMAEPLEGVLLDAQQNAAGQGRRLWLLAD